MSTTPAAMNGMLQPTVQAVHTRPQRRSRSESIGLRQGTAASSGSAALATGSAAGDWLSQQHEIRILRQLANLRGSSVAVIPDADVALLELGAEGGDGAFEVGTGSRPLRKLGVTGCIHPQQA